MKIFENTDQSKPQVTCRLGVKRSNDGISFQRFLEFTQMT